MVSRNGWKWTSVIVIVLAIVSGAAAAKKAAQPAAAQTGAPQPPKEESVIEEVSAKQLERVLNEKDYVAVFWCKFWFIYGSEIYLGKGGFFQPTGWDFYQTEILPIRSLMLK